MREYVVRGESLRFEIVCLDQENFSKVSRTPYDEFKSEYNHLRGLFITESNEGDYEIHVAIGDPTVTNRKTGHCRKAGKGNT